MRTNKIPVLLVIVLVLVMVLSPGFVWAQQGPIKIGFITSLTGTAAQAARDMVNGLQMYLDEYTFRYNHRNDGRAMFALVVERAASGT